MNAHKSWSMINKLASQKKIISDGIEWNFESVSRRTKPLLSPNHNSSFASTRDLIRLFADFAQSQHYSRLFFYADFASSRTRRRVRARVNRPLCHELLRTAFSYVTIVSLKRTTSPLPPCNPKGTLVLRPDREIAAKDTHGHPFDILKVI